MVEKIATFSSRLEEALSTRSMRPIDLAKLSGISQSTISQYRSGYAEPKKDKLVKLAKILNVDPSWLMGIDVPMNSSTLASTTDPLIIARLVSDDSARRLLAYYNRLTSDKQDALLQLAEFLQKKDETN